MGAWPSEMRSKSRFPVRGNVVALAAMAWVFLGMQSARADSLDDLARAYWQWRAAELPVSNDDIPRLERPKVFVPDWSPAAVERYRRQVAGFERRWKAID